VESAALATTDAVALSDAERLPVLEVGDDAAPDVEPGRLQIGVRPWAVVSVDGRPVGETPLAALTLRPGVYTARLVHPDYRPFSRRVTVKPGETSRLFVDLALDGIPR
jgi:serine/threonine-protein kinase